MTIIITENDFTSNFRRKTKMIDGNDGKFLQQILRFENNSSFVQYLLQLWPFYAMISSNIWPRRRIIKWSNLGCDIYVNLKNILILRMQPQYKVIEFIKLI